MEAEKEVEASGTPSHTHTPKAGQRGPSSHVVQGEETPLKVR